MFLLVRGGVDTVINTASENGELFANFFTQNSKMKSRFGLCWIVITWCSSSIFFLCSILVSYQDLGFVRHLGFKVLLTVYYLQKKSFLNDLVHIRGEQTPCSFCCRHLCVCTFPLSFFYVPVRASNNRPFISHANMNIFILVFNTLEP